MLRDVFAVFGWSAPFIYAAAVYWFFDRLDKSASGPAKQALSDWLKSSNYNKTVVAAAIVSMFDRLYGRPLLSTNSFFRSVLFTLAVTAVFAYETNFAFVAEPSDLKDTEDVQQVTVTIRSLWDAKLHLVLGIITNIISDYLSLFIVRGWLVYAGRKPLLSLLAAALFGAVVVIGFFLARDVILTALGVPKLYLGVNYNRNVDGTFGFSPIPISQYFMMPAAAIHLWLPLLAICIILIQVLNTLRWSASKLQWFLKQGQHHPLQAVGYAAALVVLIVTVVFHWLVRGFEAQILIYAATTYSIFHFLDKKASSKANRAIAAYLKPPTVDRATMASAVVELFDRLYGRPLLSLISFLRSAGITLVVTLAFYYASAATTLVRLPADFSSLSLEPGTTVTLTFITFSIFGTPFKVGLFTNIVSDYISLFFVRWGLVYAKRYSIAALCLGPLAGATVIVLVYLARDHLLQAIGYPTTKVGYLPRGVIDKVIGGAPYRLTSISTYYLVPAIAVHLWLPLMALGIILIRAVDMFSWSVATMQWFLKRGQDHPLQAIGYVATVIVAIAATVVRAVY